MPDLGLRAVLIPLLLALPLYGKRLPDIYWNSTNSDLEVEADIGDFVHVLCPLFAPSTSLEDTEQSVIYRVSRESFLACSIRDPDVRLFARCSSPYESRPIKTVFRLMSPLPGALDYRPGRDYFFISTSDGTPQGLHNREGGLCRTHSLRMTLHIRGQHEHRSHSHRNPPPSTTTESPYWEEFLEKMRHYGLPSTPAPRETIALPEKDAWAENSLHDSASYKLYEIHEIDQGDSLAFFASSSASLLTSLPLLVLVRL